MAVPAWCIAVVACAFLSGCSFAVPPGDGSGGPEQVTSTPTGNPQISDISGFQGGWDGQVCAAGNCTTIGGLEPLGTPVSGNVTGFVAQITWTASNPTVERLMMQAFLDGKQVVEQTGTSPLRLAYDQHAAPGNLTFTVHGTGNSASEQQTFNFSLHIFRDAPFDGDWPLE